MRGKARVPLVMLVLVGLTVAAFWLVALDSRHEGFNWELASIFGTAVGTFLLALATGALAYSTRSEVRATLDDRRKRREDQ